MSNTIGVFDYTIAKMKKSDNLPFGPIVHICLQQWSTSEGGLPTLSAQLMSEGEIDGNIELMKKDLDAIGRRAKRALVKAKASTLEIVQSRKNSN